MNERDQFAEAVDKGYLVMTSTHQPVSLWEGWVRYCVRKRIPTIFLVTYGEPGKGSAKILVAVTGLPQAENVRSMVRREFQLAKKRHRPARIKEKSSQDISGLPHDLAFEVAGTIAEMTGERSYLSRRARAGLLDSAA